VSELSFLDIFFVLSTMSFERRTRDFLFFAGSALIGGVLVFLLHLYPKTLPSADKNDGKNNGVDERATDAESEGDPLPPRPVRRLASPPETGFAESFIEGQDIVDENSFTLRFLSFSLKFLFVSTQGCSWKGDDRKDSNT
jgi:hypothetical protein